MGRKTILRLRTIDQSALHKKKCEVLEHIIHRNIISHVDQQRMLTDVQHEFHKRQSCETQLIKTVNDLAKIFYENQQIDTVRRF